MASNKNESTDISSSLLGAHAIAALLLLLTLRIQTKTLSQGIIDFIFFL